MSFWKRGRQDGTHADNSPREEGVDYSAIALAIGREGVGYHVECELTLSVAHELSDSPILLALDTCPIATTSVDAEDCTVSRVVSAAGRGHIVLEHKPGCSWDGQVVRVTAQWQPVDDAQHATSMPWIIAPDVIPAPVLVDVPLAMRARARQPVVTFAEELLDDLDAGGIAMARDESGEPTAELLQSVIFPRILRCTARDDGQFAFISTDEHLTPDLDEATSLLADMKEFLTDLLHVDPVTRVCVALTTDPFSRFTAPGAMIALRPDWLGIGSGGRRYEHLLVRMLTGLWWGSGCRIRGEDSLPIQVAIGAAMGLLWLESRGAQGAVDRLLAEHRTRSHSSIGGSTIGSSQVNVLARAFYHALRDPRTADNFGRLTRECWAQSLAEDVWLRRLQACGIILPDVLLGGTITS